MWALDFTLHGQGSVSLSESENRVNELVKQLEIESGPPKSKEPQVFRMPLHNCIFIIVKRRAKMTQGSPTHAQLWQPLMFWNHDNDYFTDKREESRNKSFTCNTRLHRVNAANVQRVAKDSTARLEKERQTDTRHCMSQVTTNFQSCMA